MKYTRMASSRTGSTELYRAEDGSVVEVQFLKSGKTLWQVYPVGTTGQDRSLTVAYAADSPEAITFEMPEPLSGSGWWPAQH